MTTMILAALFAAALPAQQQTDTTVAVRSGARLDIEAIGGSAVVRTWDREAVRVRATHAGGARVMVRESASGVRVESRNPGRNPSQIRYEVTVPRRFNVRIEGMNLSADVQGVTGDVSIENMEGAITVRQVTGRVSLESVSGEMEAQDIIGGVTASSVNQNIRLDRVRGDVVVEAVNGSVTMRGIDAARVRAATVNGIIEYDGSIHDGGSYTLKTHNGRITMSVPEQANATIAVSTRTGTVETTFPVSLSSTRNEQHRIRLGSGSATVALESYNGTVRLVRPAGR
jgi:DUF4097 and DUF4098 domain-containing protein YvlB